MSGKPYLVVEGELDAHILRRLLPVDVVRGTEFVVAQGSYAVQSLATTLLGVRRRPLALVVDADTTNPSIVQEKVDLLRYLVRPAAGNVPYAVFVAVPQIEVVLLHDRSLFERLVGKQLSDLEWRLALLSPKEAITNLVGSATSMEAIVLSLTDEDAKVLRQHPLVKELSDFLSGQISPVEQNTPVYNRTPALAIAEPGVVYHIEETTQP
jgi:hypothetical protein